MKNQGVGKNLSRSVNTGSGGIGDDMGGKVIGAGGSQGQLPRIEPEGEPQDVMNDHEAHDHLNTLMAAHHISHDPMKMQKVHALAGRHHAALKGIMESAPVKAPKIKSVEDLKKAYQDKVNEPMMKGNDHDRDDNSNYGQD